MVKNAEYYRPFIFLRPVWRDVNGSAQSLSSFQLLCWTSSILFLQSNQPMGDMWEYWANLPQYPIIDFNVNFNICIKLYNQHIQSISHCTHFLHFCGDHRVDTFLQVLWESGRGEERRGPFDFLLQAIHSSSSLYDPRTLIQGGAKNSPTYSKQNTDFKTI